MSSPRAQLAALQRRLQAHVLNGTPVAAALVPGTRYCAARARLAVYRDGYYLRLTEALSVSFPILHRLLGAEAFAELARAYADAQPSRHFSLRYFGHRLAAFLATEPSHRDRPQIAEMARWEWAMADAFDARDAHALEAAEIERIAPAAWPGLGLRFHPSLRVLDLKWNTAALWSALNRAAEPPEPAAGRGTWALWRRDLKVLFAELPKDEARALRLALRGALFAEICDLAPTGGTEADAALWAARLLRQWLERGWLAAVEVAASRHPPR